MKNFSKRALLVNMFGTLGYLFCLLSWAWIALLYLPILLENEQVVQFILPTPSPEATAHTPSAETSLPMVIAATAVTIFILIATILVLLRAPITLAKTGRTVTTKVAGSAIPLITRGHSIPAEKKKLLTANLIKIVKLLLVLLPVAAMLLGFFVDDLALPFDIAVLISGILAISALLWFIAQYVFASFLGVNQEQLV